MGRPRLHDDAFGERLLDAAASLIAESGLRALNVRTLAATVETSTAAVYTLFGSKAGLLQSLYARSFGRLSDGQRAVGTSDDPVADVVALGIAYRETAVADPFGYRMMFGDEGIPTVVPDEIAERAAATFDPLRSAVERCVEAGRFPSAPEPSAIATSLWANVHGLVSVEFGSFRPPAAADPAEFFEIATRANVAGWCALAN